VLGNPSGVLFLAKGRAEIGFRLNLAIAVVNLAVFAAVVPAGTQAVAWAWAGLVSAQIVVITVLVRHVIGLRITAYLGALARPLAATAATAGWVAAARAASDPLSARPVARLAVELAAVLVLAGATAWALERAFVRRTLAALRPVRPAGGGGAP
jgi:O-antigen/teichoic acid export membrane protein